MIRDTTAQRIASQWHGGSGTALYQFASTGAIQYDRDYGYSPTAREIETEIELIHHFGEQIDELPRLNDLLRYVRAKGPRPAVPDWYDRVIRKAGH